MPRRSRQALSIFVSALLLSFPVTGNAAELVGVARASGRAEINGTQFPGDTNVFSGDQLTTGGEGTLMLTVSPQERVRLASNRSVRVSKAGEDVVIALEQGEVQFWTSGRTLVTAAPQDVIIRSRGDLGAIGHVSLADPEQAQVSAQRGVLEITVPDLFVFVRPGQTALVTEEPGKLRGAGAEEAQRSAKRKKTIAIVLVSTGVAAAIAVPLILDDVVVSPFIP